MTSKKNMSDNNENFFRNSGNKLIHTVLYLQNIPTIIRGIVPNNHSNIPDYYQKFEQEELKQQSTEVNREEKIMEDRSVENFKDFSDTERKIAEIWRDVFDLSKKQFEELNKDSDFFDLLPSWCATFEINSLNRDINQIFHIPIDLISIADNSTIKELAARIDRFQDDKHKS
jgi:hypothetical protein